MYIISTETEKKIHFQTNGAEKGDLTHSELQKCVDLVNKEVQEQQACKKNLFSSLFEVTS